METNRKIPKLEDESLKKNPFVTPEGYFDSLQERIQERCAEPEQRKGWRKLLRPQLAFAVSFIALALIGKGVVTLVTDKPDNGTATNVIAGVEGDTSRLYSQDDMYAVNDTEIIDDVIISYLVNNNVSDMDIVQAVY